MTDNERVEQRTHWHREIKLLRWLIGGVAALIITAAGTGWQASRWASDIESAVGEQSGRIDALDTRYTRQRERVAAIEAVQGRDGQSIARIEERITSQGESISRIEASIDDLVRFLRNTP